MNAAAVRRRLYEVMNSDRPFDWKAERALALGGRYLDVDNAHLAEIHEESDYWRAVASTDPPDGDFPPGDVNDLETTYCRRVVAGGETVALHDAPEQGWADDPAFETHGLHCYHGTPLFVDGETYGTVCFVSENPRGEPFDEGETMFAELVARMLEHELQRERTAERVERLEQFASVLAHDLRNPLSVALGRVEHVREREDDEHLGTATEALERIRTLVTDVLTMARQGHAVEETDEVRLGPLAERCWRSVDTAGADLTVEEDVTFRAAPDRVRHLFENLFRNAVDHGGPGVSIRIGRLADGEGFYVADDGTGIRESERGSVFERGYTTDEAGTGLGLAIVDGVVAAHDWKIAVTSSAEGGARFEVSDVVVVDSVFD